jgi:transposase
MSPSSPRFSGMDVHQATIAVASLAQDHGAEVTYLGTSGTRPCDIDQRIRTRPSQATHVIVIDEAGPCGDWLYRYRTNKGDAGWVVAPARLPQQAGDRVTTDRRDAVPLARLARSGDRTAVDVPTVADDAMRDRRRAREDPRSDRQDATCRLTACWRRHDSRDTGRAHWRPAHRRWLSAVVGPTPAQPLVCPAYVRAVTAHTARRQRLAQARPEPGHAWRLHPVVEALQALRGVPCTVAVTMVADIGDLTRVDTPRDLRPFLGRIPAAYASGARRQQGSITTAGNTQARRALVEGAWASRDPAQVSRPLPRRLEPHPKMLQDISWQAHVRLCTRYRPLVARGPHATSVTVAMARELAGCMWALAREVPVTPEDDKRARIPPSTQQVPHVPRQRRRPGVVSPSAA